MIHTFYKKEDSDPLSRLWHQSVKPTCNNLSISKLYGCLQQTRDIATSDPLENTYIFKYVFRFWFSQSDCYFIDCHFIWLSHQFSVWNKPDPLVMERKPTSRGVEALVLQLDDSRSIQTILERVIIDLYFHNIINLQ